jgi:hypothetical protein
MVPFIEKYLSTPGLVIGIGLVGSGLLVLGAQNPAALDAVSAFLSRHNIAAGQGARQLTLLIAIVAALVVGFLVGLSFDYLTGRGIFAKKRSGQGDSDDQANAPSNPLPTAPAG